jgi:hypothetical protein
MYKQEIKHLLQVEGLISSPYKNKKSKITKPRMDSSWEALTKDLSKVAENIKSSDNVAEHSVQLRTKLLNHLTLLNKEEEWYNLEPEVQEILRIIIANKDIILSRDPVQEDLDYLSSQMEDFVLSKTTRGPHVFNPSSVAEPQSNWFQDPLGIRTTLNAFSENLKSTLPDKNLMDDVLNSAKKFN